MIIRAKHDSNYTCISNNIATNNRLSFRAKSIMLYAISRPDDWSFNIADMTNHSLEGRTAIRRGLEELEAHGYLIRSQKRGANGVFDGYEYTFFEKPQVSEGCDKSFSPQSGLTESATRPLLSTEKNKVLKETTTADPKTTAPGDDKSFSPVSGLTESATRTLLSTKKNKVLKETTTAGSKTTAPDATASSVVVLPFLKGLKMSQKQAESLSAYGEERVRRALLCLERNTEPVQNPYGFLLAALQHNWQPKPSNEERSEAVKAAVTNDRQALMQRHRECEKMRQRLRKHASGQSLMDVSDTCVTLRTGRGWFPISLMSDQLFQTLMAWADSIQAGLRDKVCGHFPTDPRMLLPA